MENVHVIDGNNFFSRVYFAGGRSLASVLNMLIHFKQRHKGRIIFTFDTTKSERRLEIYPEYKAGRKSSLTEEEYEEFKSVLNCFIGILKNMRFSVLEGDGYEADDYIAMLTRLLKRYIVNIHSSDGDFMQLVSNRVNMVKPLGSGDYLVINDENIEEVTGVRKEFVLDQKAMAGDKSDNIHGIDGVGEKTAVKFINEYGSFDEIFAALMNKKNTATKKKEMPTKTEEKILNGRDDFKLAKKIIDLSISMKDKKLKNLVSEKVKKTKLDYNAVLEILTEHNCEENFETVKIICNSMNLKKK